MSRDEAALPSRAMTSGSSVQRVIDHLARVLDATVARAKQPSTREISANLGVGPVTVQRALDQLVARGRIVTRPGVGSFAAVRTTTIRSDTAWQDVAMGPNRIDAAALTSALDSNSRGILQLGAGYVDDALRPDAQLALAMARAARRPGVWAAPPVRGVEELRVWFGGQLGAHADDVTITSGTQGSLSAVLRALVAAAEPVLVATPAYPGVFSIARSAGMVPVAVPADEQGLRVDLVERAISQTGARVLYLQPTFANPDGSVLTAERRTALLEIAHRTGIALVEDDCARWLGHGPKMPPPLLAEDAHGHVITICSLTKAAAPSMRVGAVIARGPVAARVADMRVVDDLYVSAPLQYAAVELVSSASWAQHLRALSLRLAQRCGILIDELARALLDTCSVSRPTGGVFLWLGLPSGMSDTEVAGQAALRKLFVVAGRRFVLNSPARHHLRLSFAAMDEADAHEAVLRLVDAIDASS
jgi:DNA-binding transcriptional MocR family regulator